MIVVIKAVSAMALAGVFWVEKKGARLYLRTEKDVAVVEPIGVRLCDRSLYTHKRVQRDSGRRGSPNNTLPGYCQAHQPIQVLYA